MGTATSSSTRVGTTSVGILVRATDVHNGVQYVRAVRMSYVVFRLAVAFDELGLTEQRAIRGYLER